MPTLTTETGKPVEVTPADADTINSRFRETMNDDGPDEMAPPKRDPAPADGKPKRGPGRPRAEDRSRTTGKAATASLSDAERASGVAGFAQIGAGLALMYGKATGKAAFEADAVTIATAAPQFADAAVQIAKHDAAFAARLDKVCSSGPYAALIAVGVNVTLQCIRNHRPGLALPGTVHPDELLRSDDGQAVNVAA